MNTKPREFDSDHIANERAKIAAVHAFQDRPITNRKEDLRRLVRKPLQADRMLVNVDVSMHLEYRMGLNDRVINAALSTSSETVRLLIEHHAKQPTDQTVILTFHAASANPEIPDSASWLRTAHDPLNPTSFCQVYARTESLASAERASADATSDSADAGGEAGGESSTTGIRKVSTSRPVIQ